MADDRIFPAAARVIELAVPAFAVVLCGVMGGVARAFEGTMPGLKHSILPDVMLMAALCFAIFCLLFELSAVLAPLKTPR